MKTKGANNKRSTINVLAELRAKPKGSATVIESSANCIFFDFIQLLFQLTVHVDYEFTHCGDDSAFEWLSSGD